MSADSGATSVGSGGATGTGGAGGRPGSEQTSDGTGGSRPATQDAGGGGTAAIDSDGGADSGEGGANEGGAMQSVTCPSSVLQAGESTKMLQVGGAMRNYLLHVPPKYDGTKPVPLILDFHGLSNSGQSYRPISQYPAQTDPEGVIMAFPSGLSGPSGGAWNVGPCCVANTDDVAFAKALVADIEKVACIDPKRIYAVGYSMGGGMSHYLACHAADVFAAVAPAAFDLLGENVSGCTPARPITVMSFRSDTDPVVPYAGGPSSAVQGMPLTFLGAAATFQKWGQINQCTGAPSPPDANNCQSYPGCKDGVEVILCTKKGGGHEPGNASLGWPVLKRHALP